MIKTIIYPILGYVKSLATAPNLGYRPVMTLNEYLNTSKTTSRQFAETANVSIFAVRKWRQGIRIPRAEFIKKIEALTKGRVKPKDWYI